MLYFYIQFYALEKVSLNVTCDEGAYLTGTGCVYSVCNGCETRLQVAASAVNSAAANVTTDIKLIGNLTSAVSGFAVLKNAASKDVAILETLNDELQSLYATFFQIKEDVRVSSYDVVVLNYMVRVEGSMCLCHARLAGIYNIIVLMP